MAIEKFNSENQWRKRGISIIPTKFGMSFEAMFMNQAGALVHVYTDGTVLVTHGGLEMGQGLRTKMIHVAASAFGIPLNNVFISETSTDKVPNASPTAGSVSSDLYGMAVLNACNIIKERLTPFLESDPKPTFVDAVKKAYFSRVSLSATGFWITPGLSSFDWSGGGKEGQPFRYYNYGAAVSEVEIDTLTGDHQIRRTDILMDVGDSLNPTIDIGQIEGAFVQGVGWCTIEELVFLNKGDLFTRGPSTYKIPGFNDIPFDFRVALLSNASNTNTIHSSKGIGEPPFFLSASVFFAIRDAIQHARKDSTLPAHFELISPATCERIRMSCPDFQTKSKFIN